MLVQKKSYIYLKKIKKSYIYKKMLVQKKLYIYKRCWFRIRIRTEKPDPKLIKSGDPRISGNPSGI